MASEDGDLVSPGAGGVLSSGDGDLGASAFLSSRDGESDLLGGPSESFALLVESVPLSAVGFASEPASSEGGCVARPEGEMLSPS